MISLARGTSLLDQFCQEINQKTIINNKSGKSQTHRSEMSKNENFTENRNKWANNGRVHSLIDIFK